MTSWSKPTPGLDIAYGRLPRQLTDKLDEVVHRRAAARRLKIARRST